jgi:hypothetical protein
VSDNRRAQGELLIEFSVAAIDYFSIRMKRRPSGMGGSSIGRGGGFGVSRPG